jgi:soluble cytochrome b562
MPSDLNSRWDAAKRFFEDLTKKSKPDPKGKIKKFFGTTGVSSALKTCDKYLDAIEAEHRDMGKKAKLIEAGAKYIPTVAKAAKSYMSDLDSAIKDEIADNNEKTTYAKGMKYLRNELDAIEKLYEQKIDGYRIALDESTSGMQKGALMVHKALRVTVANAVAGIKKVKSKPNVEVYNEVFNTSDNIMRKVQVQLVAAANGQTRGLIPTDGMRVDPRFVADKFTPWQAQGNADTKADDTWTEAKILEQLKTASGLIKLANAFLDDLEQHTR